MTATAVAHLGDVADPPQDAVGDTRRPACAARDLLGRLVGDLDAEDPRRAAHDRRELALLVVAEPERHAEAVAERRREEPGARRRADERERRQIERQRARTRALADDDVEPEVLERRVQDLLDGAVHAMDLVDEEDVLLVEPGEDRRHVALPLERRAGDRAQPDVELLADDRRERRLAEARRPDEENVVERLAARLRRLQRDVELLLDPLLADEVVESPRTQRLLDLFVAFAQRGREELDTSRCAPQRFAHALLGRQVGIDAGERLLGLDERVAELDERVTRDELTRRLATGLSEPPRRSSPRARGRSARRSSCRSPGSPGSERSPRVRSRAEARPADALETTASATFGPMPLTPRSRTKSARSAASAKP